MAKARSITVASGFLGRLLRDRAGNTLAMIAAALIPLLAIVGGGIDMGRAYLSQTRLQQACDAGVLAARKTMGSALALSGSIPADAQANGDRFFENNYRAGAYGTMGRQFSMKLEQDNAISGTAHVDVPTTIMNLFGDAIMPIDVNCQARLNFSNTDIMFVLDTTGSMADTNPGDTLPKIDVLRQVVEDFHSQLENSKTAGTTIRYGFVPYSTNVNVGLLLKSDWVVDNWDYHGRVAKDTGQTVTDDTYSTTYTYISGGTAPIGPYNTTGACPPYTLAYTYSNTGTNPDGSSYGTTTINGDDPYCNVSTDGATITVNGTSYNNYTYSWVTKKTGTVTREIYKWKYQLVNQDLAFLKGATGNDPLKLGSVNVRMYGYPSPTPENLTAYFRGCMEERDTYEITDYDNVDLTKALDLDLDLVPTPGKPETQWRPMLNEISFEPEIWWDGTGTFNDKQVMSDYDFLMAGWAGLSSCPTGAQKLQPMTPKQVKDYVDTLVPEGSTYHDIGMIWGGRLLSPTGLFAAENADAPGKPTSRHLIFLTDGETAPLDLSYGTYGIEPLDKRRWSQKSSQTLTDVVEGRFKVACDEVKKRNITVWIIGFGTTLNPVMTKCAGAGHFFEAKDSAELNDVFSRIAAQMGDLRISK